MYKYFILLFILASIYVLSTKVDVKHPQTSETIDSVVTSSPTLIEEQLTFPENYVIHGGSQVFQTFNNCGPAALSMVLSYYGLQVTQKELGEKLRPWQNPVGNNDDKSVTLTELAEEAENYGLVPFHRLGGDATIIKSFVSNNIPVITRTWLKPDQDIGHYRVIKGYDAQFFIQDDSLQGKDLRYSYEEFGVIWKKFNYEYLVLVPKEKITIAGTILGENIDYQKSWDKAVKISRQELSNNPDDVYARFNLSVALYHLGEYRSSVAEFEKVQSALPSRTLWYQIEPILSYFELGEDNKVFALTDQILKNDNLAFSELYLIRGRIYERQGKKEQAKKEFSSAIKYNANLEEAKQALAELEST